MLRDENLGIYSVSWLCPFTDTKNGCVKSRANYFQLLYAQEENIGIYSVFGLQKRSITGPILRRRVLRTEEKIGIYSVSRVF